ASTVVPRHPGRRAPTKIYSSDGTFALRYVRLMEIDPMQSAEVDEPSANAKHARLNSWVAITVALLATFMGICKVKDDNIVQAMQQAQADKLDHWAFYQARNIRQEIAQAELTQLSLARGAQPAAGAAPGT